MDNSGSQQAGTPPREDGPIRVNGIELPLPHRFRGTPLSAELIEAMSDRDVLFYMYGLGAGQESGHRVGYDIGYMVGEELANQALEMAEQAQEEAALARVETALAREVFRLREEGLQEGFGLATQTLLREHEKAAERLFARGGGGAWGWGEIMLGSFAVACFSFAALVIRDHLV